MAERKAGWQSDEKKARRALHAAGYCGEPYPGNNGSFCTRRPGRHADGDHVDHYTGRKSVTDVEGYRWPQEEDSRHEQRRAGAVTRGLDGRPPRTVPSERKQHVTSNTLPWKTSSHSTGNGACVEVAKVAGGAFFRDTKDRPRGAAAAKPKAWSAFVGAVKAGSLAA
ncbi:DUF397 domain-containing protein [Streptomyces seoulensis]